MAWGLINLLKYFSGYCLCLSLDLYFNSRCLLVILATFSQSLRRTWPSPSWESTAWVRSPQYFHKKYLMCMQGCLLVVSGWAYTQMQINHFKTKNNIERNYSTSDFLCQHSIKFWDVEFRVSYLHPNHKDEFFHCLQSYIQLTSID